MARVVVVGAGLGGLAAAARLADLGHVVTVLEQASVVGGQVGTFSRAGFTFDTGPTLLTLPAVYRDLFRKTGRRLERELELTPVEPARRYRFADGVELDLPNASRHRTTRTLDAVLGPGSGAQWDGLLRRGERIWRILRQPFVESAPAAADLVRLTMRPADIRALRAGGSLRALAEQCLQDARLRAMLESHAGSEDPRHAPAARAAIPYLEDTFGTWRVEGGMHRLADALHHRAVTGGAVVRTSVEAAEILMSGDRVSGVRIAGDGEILPADIVVSNVHARHLYGRLLGPRGPSRERRKLMRAGLASSVFSILLALRGRTAGLPHRTVLFTGDAEAELDALFGAQAHPVDDPTVSVSAPDDPALRPSADTETWVVDVRTPRHGSAEPGTTDWLADGLADSYADSVLAVLASRGLDVRHRVLWRVLRTPADLEVATRSPGGVVEGPGPTGARAVRRRAANRSPVKGLFLVGASTRPGGGVPFVGLSANIVADLVGRA